MPDPLLPSPIPLLVSFFTARPEITALAGDRIGSRLPGEPGPAVRITRVGGTPSQAWQDDPRIQVEAWGASDQDEATADLLARTLLASLADLPRAMGRRVSALQVTVGPLWSPDPTSGRARYLFDVQLNTHPSEECPRD